jgi:nitrous oxidase accessory protein
MIWQTVLTLLASQAVLAVGPQRQYQSIARALTVAAPYDTIVVDSGRYRERLRIERAVTLIGKPGAVIDGGGEGRVVEILAPATIQGFTIRGSGDALSREDAGIWISEADGTRVTDNVLVDVLFGIYIKESHQTVVQRNRVHGKPLPRPRRGDGIRLWSCMGGILTDNEVTGVRDVVIWFSDSTVAERNTITDSRYGLHYMYSDHNRFADNHFERNEVGAFLMYSNDVSFERNVFAYALGSFGKGLGFKDTDNVVAHSNLIVKNAIGIFLDNSPHSVDVSNVFSRNILAFNEVGVQLLPSVRNNQFVENSFLSNVVVAGVTGRGSAVANTWRNNYWSEYAGLDENHDGLGDTPYVHDRVTDDVLAEHESLQLMRLSTATAALDMLARLVPVLKPTPILVDSAPSLARFDLAWAPTQTTDNGRFGIALVMAGFVVVGVVTIYRRRRPE